MCHSAMSDVSDLNGMILCMLNVSFSSKKFRVTIDAPFSCQLPKNAISIAEEPHESNVTATSLSLNKLESVDLAFQLDEFHH